MEMRTAVPTDAPIAAQLIAATMGDFEIATFGLGERQRMTAALAAFYKLKGNRFSFDSTRMVEIQGNTAGLLLSFPSKATLRLSFNMIRQLVTVYGWNGSLRFLARAIPTGGLRENEPDELYIAHLATLPKFRRRGVGKFLLESAESLARKQGLTKLSLLVEPENEIAIKLYESYGFTTGRRNLVRYFDNGLHSCGLNRMVKILF